MKNFTILSMTLVLALSTLQMSAQETKKDAKKETKTEKKALRKLKRDVVSVWSKNSFAVDFGNVPDVKWKSTAYFDEATFKKDGKEMTAFYDYDGTLVGTTTPKTFADLPPKSQKEIKSKYKDYSIGQVIMFDDNEFNESDMLLYNLQFDDEDSYFVELTKGASKTIVRVNNSGTVFYFTQI